MGVVAREAPKAMFSMEEFTAELNAVMPVVTRVARRFAPAGHAEDVAQEACLAAWRYRHRFDPEQGSFQTWILKIVFHESHKVGARVAATACYLVGSPIGAMFPRRRSPGVGTASWRRPSPGCPGGSGRWWGCTTSSTFRFSR
jgi:hypothetical protein